MKIARETGMRLKAKQVANVPVLIISLKVYLVYIQLVRTGEMGKVTSTTTKRLTGICYVISTF